MPTAKRSARLPSVFSVDAFRAQIDRRTRHGTRRRQHRLGRMVPGSGTEGRKHAEAEIVELHLPGSGEDDVARNGPGFSRWLSVSPGTYSIARKS